MNRLIVFLGCVACFLFANLAFAADEAESTIRLMGSAEAELPEAVTKEISLPKAAAENSDAVSKAAQGLTNSNENKPGREQGLANADEARERGAEMAEEAQNNRENSGRSEDRPERPERRDPPNN